MLQGDLDVLLNREEFVIFMQSRVPLGPGTFHVVDLVSSYNTLKTGLCRNVVEAAKRNDTQRKTPLIWSSRTIVAEYGKVDANLKDLQISVIVL